MPTIEEAQWDSKGQGSNRWRFGLEPSPSNLQIQTFPKLSSSAKLEAILLEAGLDQRNELREPRQGEVGIVWIRKTRSEGV